MYAMPRVVEWTEPPQMDTGAPMPSIERVGDFLVVAYIRSSTTRPDSSAVVRFRGVSWVHFGPPSDERLSEFTRRMSNDPYDGRLEASMSIHQRLCHLEDLTNRSSQPLAGCDDRLCTRLRSPPAQRSSRRRSDFRCAAIRPPVCLA
jgi:hypothetical protein